MRLVTSSYRDPKIPGSAVLNCTSRSDDFGQRFSPLLMGPCDFENGWAYNVENAWQYSKVYPEHIGEQGQILPEYFQWREQGFKNKQAIRYPMGKKGSKPLFSLLGGKRLDYILARKKIYLPLYQEQLNNLHGDKAFMDQAVQFLHENRNGIIEIKDFDVVRIGFDGSHHGLIEEKLNDPAKPFGHGYMVAQWFWDLHMSLLEVSNY